MRSVLRRSFNLLLVMLLALTAGSVWCGTLRCAQCHKVIQSKYYEFPNKVYCLHCYEHVLPRCSVCRQPITAKYYTQGNKKYCSRCFNDRPRCAQCHQIITAKYFTDDKKAYCAACYKKINNYTYYDENKSVCICCHKQITGKSFVFRDGVTVCAECHNDKTNPRCTVCNAPVNPLSVKPIPYYGVYACEKHRHEAVVDYHIALALMQKVRRDMVSVLGTDMTIRCPVELKLVNKEDLYKAHSVKDIELAGFCQSRGRGAAMTHTIYILGARSRASLYTTMAHELAHAWHEENNSSLDQLKGISEGQNRFIEGFAEWVAYKTTEALGDKRNLRGLLEKKHDAYRLGLLDFLKYEKQHGKNAALQAAKTQSSLVPDAEETE